MSTLTALDISKMLENSKDSGPSVEVKFVFSDNSSQKMLKPIHEIT